VAQQKIFLQIFIELEEIDTLFLHTHTNVRTVRKKE